MADTATITAPGDTGGTTTTTTTQTAPNWYDGADADTLGYLQNRGWDKVDAKTAAFNAAKAHREAERLIGAPADKIVRLPKDANDIAAITDLRSKLGVPADEKGYDYSTVKFEDGTALDEGFTSALSNALLQANVAKDKAPTVAQAVVKFMEAAEKQDTALASDKIVQEKQTLAANWGNNYNANLVVAQNTAKTLGVDPEAVAALEKQIGYAKVMEMFRNIGSRTGEDSFVRSTAPGANGSMSKEQAGATLKERQNDRVWVDKLMAGDTMTKREFDNLTRMMQ